MIKMRQVDKVAGKIRRVEEKSAVANERTTRRKTRRSARWGVIGKRIKFYPKFSAFSVSPLKLALDSLISFFIDHRHVLMSCNFVFLIGLEMIQSSNLESPLNPIRKSGTGCVGGKFI